MKTYFDHRVIRLLALTLVFLKSVTGLYAQIVTIPIETKNHALVLQTDQKNRLRTIYFGQPLKDSPEYASLSKMYHLDDNNIGINNAAYTPWVPGTFLSLQFR